jgi:hypothetical protein
MQEHYAMVGNMQAVVTSLIFEGVLERFPGLKIVLIEGGFAWAPSLSWRMDKHWERMRKETPHLRRPPSEYLREHFWFTTQPIEEPENPQDLAGIMELVGYDRLMFSTDYPHWDFDHPQRAFKVQLTEAQRARAVRRQRQGAVRAVSRQVVARASEVAAGAVKLVTAAGREIGIFNLGGEYFALANRCPHAAGRSAPAGSSAWCSPTGRAAIACARDRSSCAAPGTAGSSTSAPANHGATERPSRRGRSPSPSSRARPGQRAVSWPRPSDLGRGRLSGHRALRSEVNAPVTILGECIARGLMMDLPLLVSGFIEYRRRKTHGATEVVAPRARGRHLPLQLTRRRMPA